MRSKIGIICMVLGILLLTGAMSLFLCNLNEEKKGEESARHALKQVIENIEETDKLSYIACPDPYDTEMTVKLIDGYGYVGYLTIPSLNLQLPILSEWSYSNLKIAPCRYSGSTNTDNLVIAGHNYRTHFSPLSKLKIGSSVIFTDMDGLTIEYIVAEIDVLNPEEVEEMTNEKFALSLFTCTYGGKSRLTVRCERVEENNVD